MSQTEPYQDVIRRLYGTALQLHPESHDEILCGERSLGRSFPKVLRDYYRFSGHTDFINCTQDRLLAPTDLKTREGATVFYEENQCVTLWGILARDWDQDDPPVHFSWNDPQLDWQFDHAHLSDFFVTMAYCQAVNGGLKNIALGTGQGRFLARIEQTLPEVRLGENRWGIRVFSQGAQACLSFEEGETHIAGRTSADLRSIKELLPIDWDLVETEED